MLVCGAGSRNRASGSGDTAAAVSGSLRAARVARARAGSARARVGRVRARAMNRRLEGFESYAAQPERTERILLLVSLVAVGVAGLGLIAWFALAGSL